MRRLQNWSRCKPSRTWRLTDIQITWSVLISISCRFSIWFCEHYCFKVCRMQTNNHDTIRDSTMIHVEMIGYYPHKYTLSNSFSMSLISCSFCTRLKEYCQTRALFCRLWLWPRFPNQANFVHTVDKQLHTLLNHYRMTGMSSPSVIITGKHESSLHHSTFHKNDQIS